jgi:hypothetical protein
VDSHVGDPNVHGNWLVIDVRHREPPLGGVAIQAQQRSARAWIASSRDRVLRTTQVLLAMTLYPIRLVILQLDWIKSSPPLTP